MVGARVGGWYLSAALGVLYICHYITIACLCLSGERPGVRNVGVLLGWESVVLQWWRCGMRYSGDRCIGVMGGWRRLCGVWCVRFVWGAMLC